MRSVIEHIDKIVDSVEHIGVFISGGFDSTVLAALVFERSAGKHITLYTVPRYDDSAVHAHRVTQWLTRKYPLVKFTTVSVGNPDEHHSRQVSSGIMESLNSSKATVLLGDTAVPVELQDGSAPVRVKSGGPRVVQPFFDLLKTDVITLAIEGGILDEVSEISHTCTESRTLRCRECWQCRERAWAFSKLGLVDGGTM